MARGTPTSTTSISEGYSSFRLSVGHTTPAAARVLTAGGSDET